MENIPNFEIVVGTYEEYLLGYKLCISDKGIKFTQSFATHAHNSSIRSLAQSGKYLASGGADDNIIIYDMVARKEHCMLNHHSATITALQFTVNHSHIMSGSADGVIALVRVGNWQLEKLWDKPSKNSSILGIAVHPTGKLALTLSSDCSLITWNLIKGRQAYIINLLSKSSDAKKLDLIKWGPCGEHFILAGGNYLELWNITQGKLLKTFHYKTRITTAAWLNEKLITIGHEDGKITFLNVVSEQEKVFEAHTKRVKCLQCYENWVVSASSDGSIKIWFYDGRKVSNKGECNTGCRCTCLALIPLVKSKEESEPTNTNTGNSDSENSLINTSDSENTDDKYSTKEVTNNQSKPIKKLIVRTKTKNPAGTEKRKVFNNDRGGKVIIEEDKPRKIISKKTKKLTNRKVKVKKLKKCTTQKWTVEDL